MNAHIGLHTRHKFYRIVIRLDHLPFDDKAVDMPGRGEFMLVEIKDEFLKEFPESVPDKVTEMLSLASLDGNTMLMNEFANVLTEL